MPEKTHYPQALNGDRLGAHLALEGNVFAIGTDIPTILPSNIATTINPIIYPLYLPEYSPPIPPIDILLYHLLLNRYTLRYIFITITDIPSTIPTTSYMTLRILLLPN